MEIVGILYLFVDGLRSDGGIIPTFSTVFLFIITSAIYGISYVVHKSNNAKHNAMDKRENLAIKNGEESVKNEYSGDALTDVKTQVKKFLKIREVILGIICVIILIVFANILLSGGNDNSVAPVATDTAIPEGTDIPPATPAATPDLTEPAEDIAENSSIDPAFFSLIREQAPRSIGVGTDEAMTDDDILGAVRTVCLNTIDRGESVESAAKSIEGSFHFAKFPSETEAAAITALTVQYACPYYKS